MVLNSHKTVVARVKINHADRTINHMASDLSRCPAHSLIMLYARCPEFVVNLF